MADDYLRFVATPMLSRGAWLADRFALIEQGRPQQLIDALGAEIAAVCRDEMTSVPPDTELFSELSDVSYEDVADLLFSLEAAAREDPRQLSLFLLRSWNATRLFGDDGWRGMHPGGRTLAIGRLAERLGEGLSLPVKSTSRNLDPLVLAEFCERLPLILAGITLILPNLECFSSRISGGLLLLFVGSLCWRDRYRAGSGRIAILSDCRHLRTTPELGRSRGVPVILRVTHLLPPPPGLGMEIAFLLVDDTGSLPLACPGAVARSTPLACPPGAWIEGTFRRNPLPRLEASGKSHLPGSGSIRCHWRSIAFRLFLVLAGIALLAATA